MKKRIFCFLFLSILLFLFFSASASAQSQEITDGILNDFSEIIPEESDVTLDDSLLSGVGFEGLLGDILSAALGEWGGVSAFFLMLMGFAVITAIAEGTWASDNPLLRRNVSAAVAAIASVSIFTSLYSVVDTVREGLVSVLDFFALLIPIVTATGAASGAVESAAVHATNMSITLSVLQKVCTGALLPLVFALFSLALASSVGEGGIASVARGIKNTFMWGMGIVCTALVGSIALQSMLASAGDNATLRAVKYAASGMIPIVGNTVASTLATLAGGLALVKSTVGVGAIAVIISLALAPLVSLLLYRLAFTVAIVFLELFGSCDGVRSFSAFRSALDALSAVYSVSVVVCIIEIVIFLKSGGAL